MSAPTAVSRFAPAPQRGRGPLAGVAEFFRFFEASSRAARAYERLAGLSDAALAKQGLSRAELPQAIYRRYLER